MENCIFCKIVKNEIPSHKIYEDEDTLVFLDIQPLTKGHCLVIPKKHYQDIFDINENDLKKVIVSAKNISEKIKKTLKADGIRISQSNGKAAGQDIMHFHMHIIPRYKNDGISMSEVKTAHPQNADSIELQKLALRLSSEQAEKIKNKI